MTKPDITDTLRRMNPVESDPRAAPVEQILSRLDQSARAFDAPAPNANPRKLAAPGFGWLRVRRDRRDRRRRARDPRTVRRRHAQRAGGRVPRVDGGLGRSAHGGGRGTDGRWSHLDLAGGTLDRAEPAATAFDRHATRWQDLRTCVHRQPTGKPTLERGRTERDPA